VQKLQLLVLFLHLRRRRGVGTLAGMVSYAQFCPVALASEFFAERWTPLILRELLAGKHRFKELQQGTGGISQSLLVQRLETLEEAGVVERHPNPAGRGYEYHLTPAGRELEGVLDRLAIWAQRWIELRQDCLNAAHIMYAVHQNLQTEHFPPRRVTVRFDMGADTRPYWLVLERPHPELCFHDPGHDTDLVVETDVETLTRVFLGRLSLGAALADGRMRLDGSSELRSRFSLWLGLSRFAPYGAQSMALAAG
jgi:DNA-binding HxlR family transcriptional regulator